MAYEVSELTGLKIEVQIHIDDTKTFTTAVVDLAQGDKVFAGLGTAKRARGDKFSEPVGTTLAVARALRDVASDMESEAAKLVG